MFPHPVSNYSLNWLDTAFFFWQFSDRHKLLHCYRGNEGTSKQRKNKIKIKGGKEYSKLASLCRCPSVVGCHLVKLWELFPVRTPESVSQRGKLFLWTGMLVSCKKQWFKVYGTFYSPLLMHLFYLDHLLCFSSPAFPLLNTLVTMETLVWMSESSAQTCFIKSVYRMVWHLSHVWEI